MLVVNSILKTSKPINAIIKGQRQVDLLKACGRGSQYNAGIFLRSMCSL